MSPEIGGAPEREPAWSAKVVALGDHLTAQRIPHAFGGAIAMNYHREPRSTLDIDVNVFLSDGGEDPVLNALTQIFDIADLAEVREQIRESGQARTLWGETYVDLFFANTEFHDSMAQRVERQPFGDSTITVLSIEDLVICKALFDRPKDWVDIDAVARTKRESLDYGYVRSWLGRFVSDDDPRHARLGEIEQAGT